MEKFNFKKLKEGFYDDYKLPKPYNRDPSSNYMNPREQAIFDAIISASSKGISQKDIERVIQKALSVAFDKDTPSILRAIAKEYYK